MENEPRWLTEDEMRKLGEAIFMAEEIVLMDNPVLEYKSGWYFWDETWSRVCGPYDDYDLASRACFEYAQSL